MKRRVICLTALLMAAMMILLSSCAYRENYVGASAKETRLSAMDEEIPAQLPKRHFVSFRTMDNFYPLNEWEDDLLLEYVTENASQVVLCKVEGLRQVRYDTLNNMLFEFDVKISDVLFDEHDRIKVGDSVTVVSHSGIIPALTAKEAERKEAENGNPHMLKVPQYQCDYTENDYIWSAIGNEAPLDVGNEYLMYLDDKSYEKETSRMYQKYLSDGTGFGFKYDADGVYFGCDLEKSDMTFDQWMERAKEFISKRGGYIEQMGEEAYYETLAQRHKN